MFIVFLKFAENKSRASEFMDGHNAWLKRGFADGVFLVAGSLQPNLGGGLVCHDTTLDALQSRVNDDPFVRENIVTAEIIELTPAVTEERLNFLLSPATTVGS